MHYYQFNIGDYHTHTSHLDPMEDIAYRRMIDWCYLHESPLPECIEEIAKKIRMREECKCIADVLHEFFTLSDDGYYNDRIISELKSYRDVSKKRKKAANTRWANKHKGLKGDASALQVESTSNAKQEPRTKNHEPRTSNKKEIAISTPVVVVDFSVFNMPDSDVQEVKKLRRKNNPKKTQEIDTQRIANGLAKEINLARQSGITLENIFTEWETRGWKSFKAEWMTKNNSQGGGYLTANEKAAASSAATERMDSLDDLEF